MIGNRRARVLSHLTAVAVCLGVALPLLWAVSTSFKPPPELTDLSLLPSAPTLDNYRAATATFPAARVLANTLFMAAAVTAVQLVVSILAAYGFTHFRFRGRGLAFLVVVATILVPNQVTIVPSYLIAARLGWVDTWLGLIVPQVASAVGIFMLRQHLRAFPRELRDAATVDGVSHWSYLWRILVPALRPVIVSLGVLLFLSSWNEYLWPLLIIDDPSRATVQVGLQAFITEQGTAWGPLMAGACLVTAPILAAYALAQRQVIATFLHAGIR